MQKIYEYQEKLMEKEKLFTELEQLAKKNGLLELKNQYRGKKHLFLKYGKELTPCTRNKNKWRRP